MLALAIGTYQLMSEKGTRGHRVLGYVWVALMVSVAVSSFWIRTIDMFMGFSVIHLLSIYVLIGLPAAVLAARQGSISRHRKIMKGTYIGGLIVAGIFTLAPGRLIGGWVFGR